jgi:hypothetical protein
VKDARHCRLILAKSNLTLRAFLSMHDGFRVPATDLPGTLRLARWTKCEKDGESDTRGIFSCGRESWMEIPVNLERDRAEPGASAELV